MLRFFAFLLETVQQVLHTQYVTAQYSQPAGQWGLRLPSGSSPALLGESSPTPAPRRGCCGGRPAAEGRVERPEKHTHFSSFFLFLIGNTFFIKDTPSIQLRNGYTGTL